MCLSNLNLLFGGIAIVKLLGKMAKEDEILHSKDGHTFHRASIITTAFHIMYIRKLYQ